MGAKKAAPNDSSSDLFLQKERSLPEPEGGWRDPDPEIKVVSDDPVEELKRQPGKDIRLCGGGLLAGSHFGEIDDLILKVNPILLGEGIPLFAGKVDLTAANLLENTSYSNGFLLLRYRLRHRGDS